MDRRPDPVLGFRIDQLGRVERPPDRDDAAKSAQRRDQCPRTQGGEVSRNRPIKILARDYLLGC